MEKKVCSKCKEEKEVCEFNKNTSRKDGYHYQCRSCSKLWKLNNREHVLEYNKNYNQKNKEKLTGYKKKWEQSNSEKISNFQKKYKEKNKEKLNEYQKKWNQSNSEKIKKTQKIWRENNSEKVKEYYKKWYEQNKNILNEKIKNKKLTNPIFLISCSVRKRMSEYVKKNNILKTNKTFEIVGLNPIELSYYLESQFTEGMSWNNYGKYGWHIDHIIPLSSAKTEKELYELCHYTNLQPLWAEDNLKKSNKII
jgi:hypothetical protein